MKVIKSVKENYIFRRAYRKGKSYVFPDMVVYVLPKKQSFPRLGITVTKKIGNAPTRNRIRRIVRAAFAEHADLLPNADIIVVARTRCATSTSTHLAEIVRQIFAV